MTIAPATHMGRVELSVDDLDRTLDYWQNVIGLRVLERDDGTASLGADTELVRFVEEPGARPVEGHTGLFHVALLVPDRPSLARWLAHAARDGVNLTGLSDHFVSEALYLSDPEGNGIEIYRDRPRDQWGHSDNGELRMATLPLDLDDVMADENASDGPPNGMPSGTTMGHVHLRVADIPASEAFYNGSLGLDVMVRSYPGALFVAAGGYHHHVGLNTWESQGAPAPPDGSLGLDRWELVLPDEDERDAAAGRVGETGDPVHTDDGVLARDPGGNHLLLTARD
jgi:catechol 2,3-dioxygenase